MWVSIMRKHTVCVSKYVVENKNRVYVALRVENICFQIVCYYCNYFFK